MKRILIFYDHFYPSYKAGGPTQSIVNMVRQLYSEYELYIVCKPHEMGEAAVLDGIETNKWTTWEEKATVYYWSYSFQNRSELRQLISDISPDVVYINGIYSLFFNQLPLWYAVQQKKQKPEMKVILSARGMLHPGALTQKALKKKIYLALFRFFHLQYKVTWHATDAQEEHFIKQQMGHDVLVKQAANFPNRIQPTAGPFKKEGELVMGTIALISPMKNHLEVLQALQSVKARIEWTIFGPVKDALYWKKCEESISKLPAHIKVTWRGENPPHFLSKAMSSFQLFIMPSKSENFGHAIVEALSAGKPVITTTTTPFTNLQQQQCGYSIHPDQLQEELVKSIEMFAAMNAEAFAAASANAVQYIDQLMDLPALKKQYHSIFDQ